MFESYITFWSIIISFTILFCTLIIKVPIWLFFTACCLITCTSLIGTFYNTIPQLMLYEDKNKINTLLLVDLFGHIIPFIIVIVSFNYLIKNTYYVKYHFIWSFIFVLLFITIYNIVNDANEIYNKDTTVLSVLMILLYITSYMCFYNFY